MALDAGVQFTSDDIFLMNGSVAEPTLERAKKTVDVIAERKARKKANRDAFWQGVGETMIVDDAIDALFGKK